MYNTTTTTATVVCRGCSESWGWTHLPWHTVCSSSNRSSHHQGWVPSQSSTSGLYQW